LRRLTGWMVILPPWCYCDIMAKQTPPKMVVNGLVIVLTERDNLYTHYARWWVRKYGRAPEPFAGYESTPIRCVVCGEVMRSRRRTKTTCSARCRKRKSRVLGAVR
jgi:hypothetical protein